MAYPDSGVRQLMYNDYLHNLNGQYLKRKEMDEMRSYGKFDHEPVEWNSSLANIPESIVVTNVNSSGRLLNIAGEPHPFQELALRDAIDNGKYDPKSIMVRGDGLMTIADNLVQARAKVQSLEAKLAASEAKIKELEEEVDILNQALGD